MAKMKQSTATKTSVTNDAGSAAFLCPNCGKVEIVRTRNERENVVKYTCEACGFTGPN
jgi:predicted RNA-binding Zn-ribbon protein involved in translation (DUF1610 family)